MNLIEVQEERLSKLRDGATRLARGDTADISIQELAQDYLQLLEELATSERWIEELKEQAVFNRTPPR